MKRLNAVIGTFFARHCSKLKDTLQMLKEYSQCKTMTDKVFDWDEISFND
jgi:hypothetical protein